MLVTVTATLVASSPAQAVTTRLTIGVGKASCPAGYVCLWTLSNYQGTGYAFYNDELNYATLPSPFNAIQDNSYSFYSHGNTSDIRFFRNSNLTNDAFLLCRGESIDYLPPNADVDPPASEPGEGWRDAISSHDFGAFC